MNPERLARALRWWWHRDIHYSPAQWRALAVYLAADPPELAGLVEQARWILDGYEAMCAQGRADYQARQERLKEERSRPFTMTYAQVVRAERILTRTRRLINEGAQQPW